MKTKIIMKNNLPLKYVLIFAVNTLSIIYFARPRSLDTVDYIYIILFPIYFMVSDLIKAIRSINNNLDK